MTRLVSIIIPVFNTDAALLTRSVQSALNQSFLLEVIVVDDGSRTAVAHRIDNLARCSDLVRVIHKKNEGVSSARNVGLTNARGEYVAFLDADDVLADGFCYNAVSYMCQSHCDVLFGCMEYEFLTGHTIYMGNPELGDSYVDFGANGIEAIKGSLFNSQAMTRVGLSPAMYVSQCAALYSREVIGSHRFDETIKISEDRLFNFEVLSECATVAITGQVWYRYIQNASSASQSFRLNAKEDLLNTANAIDSLKKVDSLMSDDLDIGIAECFQQTLNFTIVHHGFNQKMGIGRRDYVKQLMAEPLYASAFARFHANGARSHLLKLLFNCNLPGMIVLMFLANHLLSGIKHRL